MSEKGLLSIGEFSKVVGLTIKSLRLYHDKGLLVPAWVDDGSGYRYYDSACAERARIIVYLRSVEVPLDQIREILDLGDDASDALSFLEQQRAQIVKKLERYRNIEKSLATLIAGEKEAQMLANQSNFEVEEKTVEPLLVAGIRVRGPYEIVGSIIGKVARAAGRHAAGPPLTLYWDMEHKEGDADLETCFPLKRTVKAAGVEVHELAGGRCLSLIHQGPYAEISRSYERIFTHLKRLGLSARVPIREHYLKGPGMIFRGNPNKYLTEIQVLVD